MILKRIDPLSVGKILGCLYAFLGVMIGGMFSLVAVLSLVFGQGQKGAEQMGFAIAAMIGIPVFYGVIGFIGGIISAFLYNIVAGMVGGIEVEFERQQLSFEQGQ